jgi:hypothetical protein
LATVRRSGRLPQPWSGDRHDCAEQIWLTSEQRTFSVVPPALVQVPRNDWLLHHWHEPEHAVEQQTPSAQWPD